MTAGQSPSERVARIPIGGFVLEVGRDAGTEIARGPAPGDAGELRQALEAADPQRGDRRARGAAAPMLERAEAVTGYVEDAAALFDALQEGIAAGDTPLGALNRLLGVLEGLHHAERWGDVIALGRKLHGALALAQRWQALLDTLDTVEEAGHRSGDAAAAGWSSHERGTLELAAGRAREAERRLSEAHEIRRRAGDLAGQAVTSRALQVLCEVLRERLRADERGRRGKRRRLRRGAMVAAAIVLVLLGAAAGAFIRPARTVSEDQTAALRLRVQVDGRGAVRSDPAGLTCRSSCSRRFPSGQTVALAAVPDDGWEFAGWHGGGCAGTGACAVRAGADASVVGTFERDGPTAALTVDVVGDGAVDSGTPGVQDCRGRCTARLRPGSRIELVPEGERFRGWSGDCQGRGRCHVRLDSARAVVARFGAPGDAPGDAPRPAPGPSARDVAFDVAVTTPADGATFPSDDVPHAEFSCRLGPDPFPCEGIVATPDRREVVIDPGDPLPDDIGGHTLTVPADSSLGRTVRHRYAVRDADPPRRRATEVTLRVVLDDLLPGVRIVVTDTVPGTEQPREQPCTRTCEVTVVLDDPVHLRAEELVDDEQYRPAGWAPVALAWEGGCRADPSDAACTIPPGDEDLTITVRRDGAG